MLIDAVLFIQTCAEFSLTRSSAVCLTNDFIDLNFELLLFNWFNYNLIDLDDLIDWRSAGSHVSNNPNINFIVYVPTREQTPLKIYDASGWLLLLAAAIVCVIATYALLRCLC